MSTVKKAEKVSKEKNTEKVYFHCNHENCVKKYKHGYKNAHSKKHEPYGFVPKYKICLANITSFSKCIAY